LDVSCEKISHKSQDENAHHASDGDPKPLAIGSSQLISAVFFVPSLEHDVENIGGQKFVSFHYKWVFK
jgi:hypothetical protein